MSGKNPCHGILAFKQLLLNHRISEFSQAIPQDFVFRILLFVSYKKQFAELA